MNGCLILIFESWIFFFETSNMADEVRRYQSHVELSPTANDLDRLKMAM
jgi:hypothetical protein